jgi:hypothetical protein
MVWIQSHEALAVDIIDVYNRRLTTHQMPVGFAFSERFFLFKAVYASPTDEQKKRSKEPRRDFVQCAPSIVIDIRDEIRYR